MFRFHEWVAERVSWVQYPNVRTEPDAPFFKHQMPASTRAFVVLVSLIVLVVCAVALFFLALMFWAILT